jgi:hypothetical protein
MKTKAEILDDFYVLADDSHPAGLRYCLKAQKWFALACYKLGVSSLALAGQYTDRDGCAIVEFMLERRERAEHLTDQRDLARRVEDIFKAQQAAQIDLRKLAAVERPLKATRETLAGLAFERQAGQTQPEQPAGSDGLPAARGPQPGARLLEGRQTQSGVAWLDRVRSTFRRAFRVG